LPKRQHHVEQIGVSVVQRMCAAGDAQRTPLFGPAGNRRTGLFVGFGDRAHAATLLRLTKAVLGKEITGSIF
jgi:hypothetical protein